MQIPKEKQNKNSVAKYFFLKNMQFFRRIENLKSILKNFLKGNFLNS